MVFHYQRINYNENHTELEQRWFRIFDAASPNASDLSNTKIIQYNLLFKNNKMHYNHKAFKRQLNEIHLTRDCSTRQSNIEV